MVSCQTQGGGEKEGRGEGKGGGVVGWVIFALGVGESVIIWLKTATAADQKAWGHAIDFVFLF